MFKAHDMQRPISLRSIENVIMEVCQRVLLLVLVYVWVSKLHYDHDIAIVLILVQQTA